MSKKAKPIITDAKYVESAREFLNLRFIRAMSNEGITEDDILWVGSHDGTIGLSWKDFLVEVGKACMSKAYQNEFGQDVLWIPHDTVVIGDGWWVDVGAFDQDVKIIRPPTIGSSDARRPTRFLTASRTQTLLSINETKKERAERKAKAKVVKLQRALNVAKAAIK